MNDEGLADAAAANPFRLPRLHLKWKAIEVAHQLSKSPNSKIIVLGDKSGLPIILTDK